MSRDIGVKEAFAAFFEAPNRETLRELLRTHTGEEPNLDFKKEWPERGELGRHVLGLINSGGGCIVAGMMEQSDKTLVATGLPELTDKHDLEKSVRKFLPQETHEQLSVLDFVYDSAEYKPLIGKKFQVLLVDFDPLHIPAVSTSATTNLRSGVVYVRRLASTEEADHDQMKKLIATHVTAASALRPALDIKTHLEELKVLYGQIESHYLRPPFQGLDVLANYREKNPNYPSETFDQFIARIIDQKKKLIAGLLER